MRRLPLFSFCLILCTQLLACAELRLPFSTDTASTAESSSVAAATGGPKKIFVLLPLQGKYGESGQAIRNGFMAAFYASKSQQGSAPLITVLDTSSQTIAAVYQQAVAAGADFVVGPLDKDQVQTLIKGTSLSVPTLALNSVTDKTVPKLYQFGLSQEDEADQVAQRAYQDGYRRALVIAPAGSWRASIATRFKMRWQTAGGVLVEQVNYRGSPQLPEQLRQALHAQKSLSAAAKAKLGAQGLADTTPHRRQDIDMIFLVAEPLRAREIVPLLQFYYAGSLPLYATSLVYGGRPNPAQDSDLNNLKFADMPWVLGGLPDTLEEVQRSVAELWKTSYQHNSKLYALGADAFAVAVRLPQFPAQGVAGATGTLLVGEDRHIYRKLSWAQIRGGNPVVLP
jgi:uncharacterized protein